MWPPIIAFTVEQPHKSRLALKYDVWVIRFRGRSAEFSGSFNNDITVSGEAFIIGVMYL